MEPFTFFAWPRHGPHSAAPLHPARGEQSADTETGEQKHKPAWCGDGRECRVQPGEVPQEVLVLTVSHGEIDVVARAEIQCAREGLIARRAEAVDIAVEERDPVEQDMDIGCCPSDP